LRKSWESSPDLANLAKAAIRLILLCEDVRIRNQAARSFALVLVIERDGFANVLSQICDALSQSLACPVQATGLLLVFMEILHQPFLGQCETPLLFEVFTRFFLQAISILGSADAIAPDLRRVAADCVRDTIEFIPDICMISKVPDVGKIHGVLSVIPVGLSLGHLYIFQCCHRIMFNLIKFYYPVADQFVQFIFPHAIKTLSLNGPGQKEFLRTGILFWKEFAVLEVEIAEGASEPRSPKLVSHVAPMVLPLFWNDM
jgi:hypothetical protein